MKLTQWGTDLLDLVLPAGCVACGDWIPGGKGAPLVCPRCTSLLRAAPWPRCPRCHHPRATGRSESAECPECADWAPWLVGARSAYVLRPPADDLVHALKYEGWPELGSVMGDAVARVAPDSCDSMVVVPMPTTAERMRSRGYNQAELLAWRVAEVRGLPMRHALRRTEGRRSQTSLTPTERSENVRGVFEAKSSVMSALEGAHVLLVDDVLTTGATASEAASELGRMGAGMVTVLTFARALAAVPGTAR